METIPQAKLASDPEKRLEIARRMYAMRFGNDFDVKGKTLDELRGMEGVRVRAAYASAGRDYNISWRGRKYDRDEWRQSDPINRAISCANSCLYGISHAAIVSCGLSPALGFIHTGKQLSIVYDVADLYKVDITIPAAFSTVSSGTADLEHRVRVCLRDSFHENRLLTRIVNDVHTMLGIKEIAHIPGDYDEDGALPAPLWDEEEKDDSFHS